MEGLEKKLDDTIEALAKLVTARAELEKAKN